MFAGSAVEWVGGVAFTMLVCYAAITDVRTRRIPNKLVIVLAVAGLLFASATAGIPGGTVRAISGFTVGLALWLPFHALGWLGAGDVKLFAAAGSWLGVTRVIEGALVAGLAGAVLALVWMVWTYGARRTVSTLSVATAVPGVLLPDDASRQQRRTMPYGVALAIGVLVAGWMPRTLLFQ